ncbi:MAG: Gfo/Idh/MocA family protein, partial [Ilumatobacteraceae bacterium]
MSRLKLALIGLGRMGRVHAQALAKSTEIEVVAIADPSRQSIVFAENTFQNATTFAEFRHAMQHAGVEACLIASPTPLHAEMVQHALDRQLHVLCEKPLALEVDVAKKLASEAESKK